MASDVLITMRQKIESLTLFDSDMIGLSESGKDYDDFEDEEARRTKESLRRTFQQSISASVLVSLSHKRYERRRNAAMEIEKVIRNLVQEKELERVRAILILLSDDYVRSTSEDSRKVRSTRYFFPTCHDGTIKSKTQYYFENAPIEFSS